jgi:carbamoyl-phosphate synthase small subunit
MQLGLGEYLHEQGVVAIADVDTRRLTTRIREKGALAGSIVAGPAAAAKDAVERALGEARGFPGLKGMDLARVVSRTQSGGWDQTSWALGHGYGRLEGPRHHVVAYDFGVKFNILRLLADRGCRLTVVPATTPADEVLAMKPDGVFLSNGPGDPDPCDYAIRAIGELLDRDLPIFGICLGHQLLGLASGARTVKMPHGHHGANHPVKDLRDQRIVITSQNHGFAVDAEGLPNCLEVTHVSLFDGTLQGIRRTDRPALGFQGHPEASPGPQDCQYLFDEFIALMDERHA